MRSPRRAWFVVWGLVAANLIAALLDGRRRTLYDRLARTHVVLQARPFQPS